jgi:PAS domain S-box-containing protein
MDSTSSRLVAGPVVSRPRWVMWWRTAACIGVVGILMGLAALNVATRATWDELEDGVLWADAAQGVTATEVAPGTAAASAGIRRGDIVLAIDGLPIDSTDAVVSRLHQGRRGNPLTYTILRSGRQQVQQLQLMPVPQGNRPLYFALVAVGAFTLLVGLSVRLRRPENQATLHFFWLSVALFGVLAFSYSGRWDRLDRFFYWADAVASVLLPPLFLHFSLVFPERPNAWVRSAMGRTLLPSFYVPALLIGASRMVAFDQAAVSGTLFSGLIAIVDRVEQAYLAVCLVAGLAILVRALRRARSVTIRRQLRWIVWGTSFGSLPFLFGYLLPAVAGFRPPAALELTALGLVLVPLSFASAIVRYRLMDVEVIIKRGLVYAAAISAIAVIYAVLLRAAGAVFFGGSQQHNTVIAMLATLVVVLLARPVKNAIQTTLDRAYYRDRYDYRRALVAFARDLNSDLDLYRLSDRLVSRVTETLLVDRMALMLTTAIDGKPEAFTTIRAAGFPSDVTPPPLSTSSGVGARILSGHTIALDDAAAARRFAPGEVAFWRAAGIHYFIPCVSKEGTIAILGLGRKESGEPLNSEDMALLWSVAGQVATALENGRLYRQLRLKADELDRTREFAESILESLSEGLMVVDRDEQVLRWNSAMETLYGISRADAFGRKLEMLFDRGFVETLRSTRREAEAGATNPHRASLTTRHHDGPRHLLVNAAAAALQVPGGGTAGTILIIEDVTTRAKLEEQLQISEKMASIGLLAAGVAHEVNTPLTGISSFTQMLLQNTDKDDPDTKILEKIERQTFRAAKIVNGLLNLARPAQVETGPVDVHLIVNDVLALLEHQLRVGSIKVRKDLAVTAPIVEGIEYKLQQVFLNLFLNARDAMPRGGWLSISTRQVDGRAEIEVADTGFGIPSEHLSRIYDPFFTTKAIGQGTGLGLSITYGIVQEHGGTISCTSAPDHGTRFKLMLPLAALGRRSEEAAY